MTINSTESLIAYQGDGVAVEFAIPFPFFDRDEIEILDQDLASGQEQILSRPADYEVVGGNGSTGSLLAVTPPAAGRRWIIVRRTKRLQLTDYTPNDPFPAETHERALDRLQAQIQELGADLDRSLKLPLGLNIPPVIFPLPAATQFLRWDTQGQALENASIAGLAAVGLPVSLQDGGTGATNPEEARQALGLATVHLFNFVHFR